MSFIDTIHAARAAFATSNAVPPNAIFLGVAEQNALAGDLAYSQTFVRQASVKHEVIGLRIFRVDEASHLTVCNTPEAER